MVFRNLVFSVTLTGVLILFLLGGRVNATYVDEVPGNGSGVIGSFTGGEVGGDISWNHTLEGLPDCNTGSGPTWVQLSIWADDVDIDTTVPYIGGPETSVQVSDGTTTLMLGALKAQASGITTSGFTSGPGGSITETVFSSKDFASLLSLDYSNEITVTVSALAGWQVEIERSKLEVNCAPVPIPGGIWLLGSGLICLVGMSRGISKRKRRVTR